MPKKNDSKCSNNKKTLKAAVQRAAAMHRAIMRDDQFETPIIHPGQISIEAMLFPVFDYEVES